MLLLLAEFETQRRRGRRVLFCVSGKICVHVQKGAFGKVQIELRLFLVRQHSTAPTPLRPPRLCVSTSFVAEVGTTFSQSSPAASASSSLNVPANSYDPHSRNQKPSKTSQEDLIRQECEGFPPIETLSIKETFTCDRRIRFQLRRL